MSEKQKFEPAKRLKKADGTIAYIWEGKLHNWDGPALIPEGDNRKREYYIHGIQYSEQEWKDRKNERQGLPYYKQSGFKEVRF